VRTILLDIPTSAPLKTWIQEAKDESKWNALISDRWKSLEDEDDEDEDQQTESESEIPTTQEVTSLEEEDEHIVRLGLYDIFRRFDRSN
jgi:hypothetical protein